MHMNSGKSMDDILDSIRKIVHEEETGEAPALQPANPQEIQAERGDGTGTLVLTREMRVDQDDTLHLSHALDEDDEEAQQEAVAVASLRRDPVPARDDEADRAAIASLRVNRQGDDHSAEVAAFDAALAEDEHDEGGDEDGDDGHEERLYGDPEDATADMDDAAMDLSALDDAEGEEPEAAGDKDAYGFATPPREDPRRRPSEAEELSSDEGVSLRLNRDFSAFDDAEDADGADEDVETEATGMAFSLGSVASVLAETNEAPADADDAPSPEKAAPAASNDDIQRMVREAVRDELSGALGDKITRNIRGMVRREIKQVMETKQLN